MKSQLWLALRLAGLPLRVFPESPPEQAVCVLEKQTVVAVNTAALKMGVHIGLDATTARLLSDCLTYQRDLSQEQEHLDQLAEHLYAFTPYLRIYRPASSSDSGLLLEVSRCLKLFGGINTFCEKVFAAMADELYCYGLAHTPEGAWLLSYDNYAVSGKECRSVFIERLKRIPIERLSDWPDATEALKRTGFDYLGDIAQQIQAQSISGIKKRFGQSFAEFIAKLFGIDQGLEQAALFDQPIQAYQPKELFFDTIQFDYPVTQIDQLQLPFEQMLQTLAEFLRKRKLACQHIQWRLFDIHHNSQNIVVHCTQMQNHWKLLYDLTFIQLERQQLSFAVDAVELTCQHLQKWQDQNHTLNFSGRRNTSSGNNDLALIEAKLNARLGEGAIFKISYKDSHIPEQNSQKISLFTPAEQQLPPPQQTAPRPTWLFETPFPAKLQQQTLCWRGKLQLLFGPERIEGQWWISPVARDYYIAMRDDGLRVWIYRNLEKGNWFVQGVFG